MKTNNKTKSYNGIVLKNEMISAFADDSVGYTHIFKYFLVVLTSLCAVMSFVTATKMTVNLSVLIFIDVVIAGLICSFKMKNKNVRLASVAILTLIILFFIWKYKAVINGFKHILNQYMEVVESEKLFDGLSGTDKSLHINLAFSFLSMLITFGLCFTLFYRFSFLGTFCLTFPFVELGFFWGFVPNHLTFWVLLCVWFVSLCSQNFTSAKVKVKKGDLYIKKPKQNVFYSASEKQLFINGSKISSFCVILSIFVLIASLIIGAFFGERPESIINTRSSIKLAIENFKIEEIPMYVDDIMSNFDLNTNIIGSQIDSGKLGKDGKLVHKNKTMLEIELEELFPCDVLYLKGYSGGVYTGDSWEQLDNDDYEEYEDLFKDSDYNYQDYISYLVNRTEEIIYGETPEYSKIFIKDKTNSKILHIPYSTYYNSIKDGYAVNDTYFKAINEEYHLEFYRDITQFTSIPNFVSPPSIMADDNFIEYEEFVQENYLDFEEDIIAETYNDIIAELIILAERDYYTDINTNNASGYYFYEESRDFLRTLNYNSYDCKKDGFIDFSPQLSSIGEMGVATAISEIIQKYFDDNFSYTLEPGKTPRGQDFVQYFLEKQKKGYCTYFASAGTLLMRAFGFPARYAEGFVAPKNEFKYGDGVYKATIKDKYAHAWCEVFIPDIGWVPVEFTPGYEDGMMNYEYPNESITTTTTQSTTTTTSQKATTTTEINDNKVTSNSENATTTVTTKKGSSKVEKADYSGIIKIVVTVLIAVFTVLLILYLWKVIYDKKRAKHDILISYADRNRAVTEIFKYLSKIFDVVGIKGNAFRTDIQNVSEIHNQLVKFKADISIEEFETLTKLAVEADMSKNTVTESSYEFALQLYKKLAEQIYENVSPIRKLILRYFKFLY